MWKRLHVKYPLSFSDFNKTWIFLDSFSKKILNIKFHKKAFQSESIRSMRTDRRTGMTKLRVAFRSFANVNVKLQTRCFQKNCRTVDKRSCVNVKLKSRCLRKKCTVIDKVWCRNIQLYTSFLRKKNVQLWEKNFT